MNRAMNLAVFGLATIVFIGCNRQSSTTNGPKTANTSGNTPVVEQKKLKVTLKETESIKRGKEETLQVKITRTDFKEPVKLTVSDLPKGVTATDTALTIASGSDSQTFTFKAADNAALGEHTITITATAPGVTENKQMVKLKVTE